MNEVVGEEEEEGGGWVERHDRTKPPRKKKTQGNRYAMVFKRRERVPGMFGIHNGPVIGIVRPRARLALD